MAGVISPTQDPNYRRIKNGQIQSKELTRNAMDKLGVIRMVDSIYLLVSQPYLRKYAIPVD